MGKIMLFISVSLILIYMGVIVRKKVYFFGGLVFLFITAVVFGRASSFIAFFEKYISFLSPNVVLWTLYISAIMLFLLFVGYSYREETLGQNPPILKDDLARILKPTGVNVIFMIFLVLLNIIVSAYYK